MKILVDGLPYSLGGIGTLLLNIIQYNKYIGKDGVYKFEFLIPVNSEYEKILEDNGYIFYEVPSIYTVSYRRIIKEIFDNNIYEYVWINNTSKVNIFLPEIAKKHGVKVISHSHGVACEETGLKKLVFVALESIYGKKYCNLVDIPFACSKASAEYFYPSYLLKRCKIIHNGILADKYRYSKAVRERVREKLQISENDILLGAVGRLTKVKNYMFLFPIIKQLPDRYKLILIGEGEDYEILQKDIMENNLASKAFLLGRKNDVAEFLCAMDIFVMPSLNEGAPFALIEAQANGLKCIVSDGISKEVNLTGMVKYISISRQNEWKKEIMETKMNDDCTRIGMVEIIKSQGYSIEDSYQKIVDSFERNK